MWIQRLQAARVRISFICSYIRASRMNTLILTVDGMTSSPPCRALYCLLTRVLVSPARHRCLSAQSPGYNVSRYVQKLTFVPNMSYHIHILCSLADFHVRRWRGGGCCYYSQQRLTNSQQQFESHQWIFVRAPEDISIRLVASNKGFPEEISSKFFGLSTGCQTIFIHDCWWFSS